MYWKQESAPTPRQAALVEHALSAIHCCIHLAMDDVDDEVSEEEWDELLEEFYEELTEGVSTRELVRALLSAATSITANYENVSDMHHGEMIAGLQRAIIDYKSGMN